MPLPAASFAVLAAPGRREQRHARELDSRRGAPGDADLATLWDLIQTDFYANQRVIIEILHKRRALKPALDVTRATDILWTLNHPDVWLLLVDTRGWTPDEFEKWFADTACAQLLKPAPRAKR